MQILFCWPSILLFVKLHFTIAQGPISVSNNYNSSTVSRAFTFWDVFGANSTMSSSSVDSKFRLLSSTVAELRTLLDDGKITSRELIAWCLDQIEKHNGSGMKLRAILSVMPSEKALAKADELDQERKSGKTRGPFHGIPIIVKDTINTDPELGMLTTLGSPALLDAKPAGSAKIIKMLISQGIIILGKANLSEFGATKSPKARPGFSPVGGQTQSPYINGGVVLGDSILGNTNPGGSSSGSAVGVAAGFSPWSIGGETDGSLIGPAGRSSLYALKPTVDSVSDQGVFMLTQSLDSLGGMAKCVADLATLTELLLSTAPKANQTRQDLAAVSRSEWKDLRIGFVDPELWRLPGGLLDPDENYKTQTLESYQKAMDLIKSHGAKVVYPVEVIPASKITFEGQSAYNIIRNAEFRPQLNKYLQELASSPVRSLTEVIQFNIKYPELAFSPESPDQAKLLSMQDNQTPDEFVSKALAAIRKAAGNDNIDRILRDHDLDVIIAPTDSPITGVSALAGYPIGTMPLGYLNPSGRPYGLSVLGTAHDEGKILSVMNAWEASTPPRRLPMPLLNWESKL